jgi:solute carrier family 8 (sodium/calcium exchanger)
VKTSILFDKEETYKYIDIEIIDDNEWEPDEVFFVKMNLDLDDAGAAHSLVGKHSIVEVTIVNDDGK